MLSMPLIPTVQSIEVEKEVNSIIEEKFKNFNFKLLVSFKDKIGNILLRHFIGLISFLLSLGCIIATLIFYPLGVFLINFHQFTIGLGIACYAISLITGTLSLPLLLLASLLSPIMGYEEMILPYIAVLLCCLILMYFIEGYDSFIQLISDLIHTIISIITP